MKYKLITSKLHVMSCPINDVQRLKIFANYADVFCDQGQKFRELEEGSPADGYIIEDLLSESDTSLALIHCIGRLSVNSELTMTWSLSTPGPHLVSEDDEYRFL